MRAAEKAKAPEDTTEDHLIGGARRWTAGERERGREN